MKTVMAFGTFDNFHPGHLSYLKQAKKQGEKLVVIVARDINVKQLKGQLPRQREGDRIEAIKKLDIVDQALLGQKRDKYNIIKKINPDVICLGYDQTVEMSKLKQVFKGEIKRLKSHFPERYKSSKVSNGT